MKAPALMCAALEIALNRYLALEPDVLAEFAKLDGRVVALTAAGPGWEFFVVPNRTGVQVLDEWAGKPDVRITAPPSQLLKQALRAGRGEDAIVSGVTVEGDAALLAKFGALLSRVGFDPEEWLARTVGDGAAHRLNGALRGLVAWGRSTAATLSLDTAEYLREETRDLVHRADVERFNDDVDELARRAAGLEALLERMERRRA
jgi:ubiquinone biosynthesis accessory factor UbiJ